MTEAVAARPFSAAANRHGEGWALAAICALAVALRLVLLRLYPGILHPDEVFQYLEQANRVVHGSGLVPWEYAVGLRNWLAPGLVAGAMAVGGLLGVHLLLCALSLGPVVCGFWWGRRHAGLAGAVTVGLLNAAWFQTVYFSSHVLSETLATAPLYVGLFLADQGGRTRWRPFWAGMLLGLAGDAGRVGGAGAAWRRAGRDHLGDAVSVLWPERLLQRRGGSGGAFQR